MTLDQAEDFLGTYRVNVRRWSLMMSGLADGDPDAMRLWIEEAAERLEQISVSFPELAESANALRGLRRHTSKRGNYIRPVRQIPDAGRGSRI